MNNEIGPTWEEINKEIDEYIVKYFFKIEWYYGDNRAPFAYPAKLYIKKKETAAPVYVCELVMEDPGAENIIIEEKTPALLFIKVKETINSTFTSFEDDVE